MSQNPFTFGNPINDPNKFIGRDQAVRQIVSRLLSSAHESTSVVGERRIGKTSLLKHLSDPKIANNYGLNRGEYCLVYIDFQGLTDITPLRFWQRVLRIMSRRIKNEKILIEMNNISHRERIDLFDLEDLFFIIGNEGLNIVLLMDEFEFVTQNPNFGSDFFGGLRALAIHSNLSLVPSTRRELVDLCHSEEIKGSPFFNIFATVLLRPFTSEQVVDLLHGYSIGTGFDFTGEEINFITKLVGGHPIFTQIGGYYMFDGKLQGMKGTQLYEFVIESFRNQADQHFKYYWSHSSESEKITLLAAMAIRISDSKKKKPTKDRINELHSRASLDINELIKRGMMVEKDEFVYVFSPVFEQWISIEVAVMPGEEETVSSVEQWMAEGGYDQFDTVKKTLPKFKKKYWGAIGNVIKEFTLEVIGKITVDMITGSLI
ncbi:AAA-like domain-containing protein [Chloroflexota bacterium]